MDLEKRSRLQRASKEMRGSHAQPRLKDARRIAEGQKVGESV